MLFSDYVTIAIALNAAYVAYRVITRKDAWLWCCAYWTLVTLRWVAVLVGC